MVPVGESGFEMVFVLLLAAVPLCAVALILWVVFKVLGGSSGWGNLASRFQTPTEPQGFSFAHQTIALGVVRYRNCAKVVIGPQGIYVKPWFAGKALLIPWHEVRSAADSQIYFRRAVALTIGLPDAGAAPTLTVFPQLFEPMRPYLAAEARRAAAAGAWR